MNLEIRRLNENDLNYINKIARWFYNWWGKRERLSIEEVVKSINNNITFIGINTDQIVGVYQILDQNKVEKFDDTKWLGNVYVDEQYRDQGVLKQFMNDLPNKLKELNIKKLYLHTRHNNLYEKYGWKFLKDAIKENGEMTKVYYMDVL